MTSIVQSATVSWAAGSQGSTKTITFASAVTPGNVVIVEMGYSHDVITDVSGLGVTGWQVIRSREGSSAYFPSAEIWYTAAVSATTTITITPNSGFGIDAGYAVAREYSGLLPVPKLMSTVSSESTAEPRVSPALACGPGDVYVAVSVNNTSTAPTITDSPSAFTAESSVATGSGTRVVSGARIATGSETPSLSMSYGSAQYGIEVAAVFQALATVPQPASISGLGIWYKADDYVQADSSAAPSTWADDSGHTGTANLAKTGTVTYRTARTPAGGPAFAFAGAGSYASAGNPFSGWTGATVFIVVKDTLSSGENQGPWNLGGGDITFYPYSDGKINDGAFTSSRASNITPTMAIYNTWRVYCITSGGGSFNAFLDNVNQVTASLGFAAPSSAVFGKYSANFTGEIAEILAYNSVLSSTDRTGIYSYLVARHMVANLPTTDSMVATSALTVSGSRTAVGVAAMAATSSLTATALNRYEQAVLADSPSLFWKMDESSGTTATDISGNGRHGTISGSPTLGQPALGPALGSSMRFAGTSGQYVSYDNTGDTGMPNGTSLTIEFVVKPNSLRSSSVNAIVQLGGRGGGSDGNHFVRLSDAGLRAGQWSANVATVGSNATSPYDAVTGSSYHVVMTRSGTAAALWVNGVQIMTWTVGSGSTADNFFRAAWNYNDGRQIDGWISDVAVYPTALSSSRIAAHYSASGLSIVPAAAALSATSSLTAGAVRTTVGSASLTATSTIFADTRVAGFANLQAATSLTVAGSVIKPGAAALVAASTLFSQASVIFSMGTVAITLSVGTIGVTTYSIDRSGDTLTLGFVGGDSTVEEQPGLLNVTVGNGPISGTVYFYLDSDTTPFAAAPTDESGGVNPYAVVPISGLTVGTHTLLASDADTGPTSVGIDFDVLDSEDADTDPTPDPPTPITTVKWTFQTYDYATPSGMETYEFPLNPISVKHDSGEVALTAKPTTVYDGTMVTWEGATRPGTMQFTGRVFTKADHDALVYWASLNQRVWLTDELSRRHLIKIENLSMTRKRNVNSQWDHEYTMTASILNGLQVTP